MSPFYVDERVTVHHGDCLDVLATLPDSSVDAVVTDPPYGLEFMGKSWDRFGGEVVAVTDTEPIGRQSSTPFAGGGQRVRFGAPGSAFQAWCEQWAAESLRVLKPGGHMLAFGGTRTWHRLTCAVEDAGFEIRDSIAWLYGSGFPKSLDVSKAIDRQREEDLEPSAAVARWLVERMAERGITRRQVTEHFDAANAAQQWTTGWTDKAVKPRVPRWEQWQELRRWLDLPDDMDAEVWRLNGRKGTPGEAWGRREVVGLNPNVQRAARSLGGEIGFGAGSLDDRVTAPATDAARQWQGWGTALKPAFEPVVVARRPLAGTVAANVLTWGTGALNVDGCRVDDTPGQRPTLAAWELDEYRCDSCAGAVERKAKPGTPETKGSIATKLAAPSTNVKAEISPPATSKTDTGCSDGTQAEDATNSSSSTAASGKMPTAPFLTDTSSTTAIMTHSTTGSKTCSSCGAAITTTTTHENPTFTPTGQEPRPTINASTGSVAAPGRWPPNVVLDGHTADQLDQQTGTLTSGANPTRRGTDKFRDAYGDFTGQEECIPARGADSGGGSRFFPVFRYEPKAPTLERPRDGDNGAHPTVKPLDLMRWLVRLVTPPGGTVLDPFAGSGTTAEACIVEGLHCITIEREASYLPLIVARLQKPIQLDLFGAGT